jgi:predicted DNA-binding transcriptional regulator AlpA
MEKAGLFPKKIILTKRTVGWNRQEIDDFLAAYELTHKEFKE